MLVTCTYLTLSSVVLLFTTSSESRFTTSVTSHYSDSSKSIEGIITSQHRFRQETKLTNRQPSRRSPRTVHDAMPRPGWPPHECKYPAPGSTPQSMPTACLSKARHVGKYPAAKQLPCETVAEYNTRNRAYVQRRKWEQRRAGGDVEQIAAEQSTSTASPPNPSLGERHQCSFPPNSSPAEQEPGPTSTCETKANYREAHPRANQLPCETTSESSKRVRAYYRKTQKDRTARIKEEQRARETAAEQSTSTASSPTTSPSERHQCSFPPHSSPAEQAAGPTPTCQTKAAYLQAHFYAQKLDCESQTEYLGRFDITKVAREVEQEARDAAAKQSTPMASSSSAAPQRAVNGKMPVRQERRIDTPITEAEDEEWEGSADETEEEDAGAVNSQSNPPDYDISPGYDAVAEQSFDAAEIDQGHQMTSGIIGSEDDSAYPEDMFRPGSIDERFAMLR